MPENFMDSVVLILALQCILMMCIIIVLYFKN